VEIKSDDFDESIPESESDLEPEKPMRKNE